MSEEKRYDGEQEEVLQKDRSESTQELSPTWAQDALADLEDWIEEQGIYLRQ